MIFCKINILFCVILPCLQLFTNRSMLVCVFVVDEVDGRFIEFSFCIELPTPYRDDLFLGVALQRNAGETDVDIFLAFHEIESFDLYLVVVVEGISAQFCLPRRLDDIEITHIVGQIDDQRNDFDGGKVAAMKLGTAVAFGLSYLKINKLVMSAGCLQVAVVHDDIERGEGVVRTADADGDAIEELAAVELKGAEQRGELNLFLAEGATSGGNIFAVAMDIEPVHIAIFQRSIAHIVIAPNTPVSIGDNMSEGCVPCVVAGDGITITARDAVGSVDVDILAMDVGAGLDIDGGVAKQLILGFAGEVLQLGLLASLATGNELGCVVRMLERFALGGEDADIANVDIVLEIAGEEAELVGREMVATQMEVLDLFGFAVDGDLIATHLGGFGLIGGDDSVLRLSVNDIEDVHTPGGLTETKTFCHPGIGVVHAEKMLTSRQLGNRTEVTGIDQGWVDGDLSIVVVADTEEIPIVYCVKYIEKHITEVVVSGERDE